MSGTQQNDGYCEFTTDLAANDKFVVMYNRKDNEGTVKFVHGSGKFAGITGEGKLQALGDLPPPGMPGWFGGCDRATGTYTIK
jgi:hypothetical protein